MNQVPPGNLLHVGKVLGLHGRRGLLRVRSYASSEASFLEAGTVFLRVGEGPHLECRVISAKPHKNVLLMELEGVRFRDEAERLKNAEVFIQGDRLTREADEFFWHELIGLDVYVDTGRYLGQLVRIISQGGNDIYVIEEGSDEYLIPATHEVIQEIDLQGKKMIISEMEGLLELNEV